MRTWTKSACVVLAWGILSITLVAVGMKGSVHPAQANTRTASSSEVILTRTLSVAVPSVPATSPATTYVVQYGDTLSGIAARFHIRGGWPPLYTANLKAIGWDPNAIRPGTALLIPGPRPVRYTVATGDTLSGIAVLLGVRGGWPTLYAANRHAIGPDPNTIRPGTVLRVPHRAAPAPTAPGVTRPRHPAPAPSPSATPPHSQPVTQAGSAGMPQWLKTMLLVVGLLILLALVTEPVLVARRRRQAAVRAAYSDPAGHSDPAAQPAQGPEAAQPAEPIQASPGQEPGSLWPAPEKTTIVVADHDRLVVTRSKRDDTVYVLRPPGEDPQAILRVARLVLPEGPYGELARQLGMPAIEPAE